NASGGASGAAQSGGGSSGAAQACTNGTPCGGSIVGTWKVSSSCIKLDGKIYIGLAGLDPNACTNPTVTGSLSVTGTLSATGTTFTDGTTTTGDVVISLPAGCLNLSGTQITCDGVNSGLPNVGLESVDCQPAASGGGCTCKGKVNHPGGIGLLASDPQLDGEYTSAANALTLAPGFDGGSYPYCVAGTQLTLSPKMKLAESTGSVVLTKDDSSGAGGMSGTGGTAGSGGSMAMAGAGGGIASAGAGGAAGSGGSTGSNAMGPCDVYAAANMPCVAAYSKTRRLNSKYVGMLYQVRSGSSTSNTGSGGMLKDIGTTADGYADTTVQDTFCAGTICTVSVLYDQSGNGNDLKVAKKGLSNGGANAAADDFESSATKESLMVGGHKVYSLFTQAREGYRLQAVGKNMPKGSASQGIYMIANGLGSGVTANWGSACCFDFGNVSTDPTKYGIMNTLFFGTAFWGKGAGSGPWFMADFEAGVWAGGSKVGDPGWGSLNDQHPVNSANPSMRVKFAMGILKTSTSKWALRSADTQTATDLTTSFEGALPKAMNNEQGIVLGVGGDNSNNAWGTFYEGAIVAGYPTTDTDLAVMNNVRAAGYGK
ncbi:MAG: arabinofuranosidase catalytic domain-containing protein, partial [Polyangiaceae bacterium]